MYCIYCGAKLPDEARFCFMCGERVEPDRSAEDDTASAGECNDKEAADANEAARAESPNTFAGTNDADEKAADVSEATDEEPRGESAANEKRHNELEAFSKNDADEDTTANQPDKEARNASESTDKSTSNEKDANKPETSGEDDADGAKVAEGSPTPNPIDSPAPNISSDETTVIPLAAPSDKTTILPGFGAEKRPSSRKSPTKSPRLQLSTPTPALNNSATPRPSRQKAPTSPNPSRPCP